MWGIRAPSFLSVYHQSTSPCADALGTLNHRVAMLQVKRTHYAPSTPSDISHLLPPLRVRKLRPDRSGNSLPIPPDIEPSLPRPAPVDRNLSDLYDPALDPSPIGREERGAVQPVRIARVSPLRELFPGCKEVRGVTRLDENPGATVVTILNGYRTQSVESSKRLSGDGWGSAPASDEEACIDIFVEGFSRGIDHTTLLPSEIFCRALQTGSRGPSSNSSTIPRESPRFLDARGGQLGLTVYLARAGAWLHAASGKVAGQQHEHRHEYNNNTANQNGNELAAEAKITRMMFQREDGTPGPSRNAFRVQFEPGPLGIELEEYPGQRGIVQVRHVLQSGQAELDGRLSAGCFVVAVGDWDEPDTSIPRQVSAENAATTADDFDRPNTSGERSNAAGVSSARIHKPAMIRSLAEFEEAVSSRQLDRLFVLWALDRYTPEALTALEELNSELNRERTAAQEWSMFARSANAWQGREENLLPPDSRAQNLLDLFGAPILQRSMVLEGAPGWESGSAFGGGKNSLEYSLSSDEPGVISHGATRAREEGGLRTGEVHVEGSLTKSAVGFLERNAEGPSGLASEGEHRACWTKKTGDASMGSRLEKGGIGDTRRWEFETGGGIFDEDDQGVAPRTQPSSNGARVQAAGPSPNETGRKPPPFPLGLQASAVDEIAVFIWFCNSHESATMNVRIRSSKEFHCVIKKLQNTGTII